MKTDRYDKDEQNRDNEDDMTSEKGYFCITLIDSGLAKCSGKY